MPEPPNLSRWIIIAENNKQVEQKLLPLQEPGKPSCEIPVSTWQTKEKVKQKSEIRAENTVLTTMWICDLRRCKFLLFSFF